MSLKDTATITCPSCGEEFNTEYWSTLNAQVNPDVKEKLIS